MSSKTVIAFVLSHRPLIVSTLVILTDHNINNTLIYQAIYQIATSEYTSNTKYANLNL